MRVDIGGRTMGTSWQVNYFDDAGRNFQKSIDSLLVEINQGINAYDQGSALSEFNRSRRGIELRQQHFRACLMEALKIADESNGSFDPTVMPLVNAWGFGPGSRLNPDREKRDSILQFVGYKRVNLRGDSVIKADWRVQLDFGGIGQGYAVDAVCEFLRSKNIQNFLVEIGGEGFASGINETSGGAWRIGIVDPRSSRDEQQLYGYVSITDRAFTTSGNFFNYRIIDGKKYGHTIDPKTGEPTQREIISATVFGTRCTHADAWATAFMVMGIYESKSVLQRHPELSALLISPDASHGLEAFTTENLPTFTRINSDHDH